MSSNVGTCIVGRPGIECAEVRQSNRGGTGQINSYCGPHNVLYYRIVEDLRRHGKSDRGAAAMLHMIFRLGLDK